MTDGRTTLPVAPANACDASTCAVTRVLSGPVVQIGARFVLAAIFVYAAIPKIGDPAGFARDIANYRLLPASIAPVLAVTLPWVELLAALCLAVGFWTRGAAALCIVLLGAFTAATLAAVVRGLNIECGCFGKSGAAANPVGWVTVLRDAAFLVPAVIVTLYDRGRWTLLGFVRRMR